MLAEELWRAHSAELSKDSDGEIIKSGSFSYWVDDPVAEIEKYFENGDFKPEYRTINALQGQGSFSVPLKKVSVTDNVVGTRNGKTFRQWQITVEGDTSEDNANPDERETYSLEEYTNDAGQKYYRASKTVVKIANALQLDHSIGGKFTVPLMASNVQFTCTRINYGDDYTEKNKRRWTVTYEGSYIDKTGANGGLPTGEGEGGLSESLNGVTTRSVAGDFIVLLRSGTPVRKKTLVRYSRSNSPLTVTLGAQFGTEEGVVTSHRKTLQIIKENGTEIDRYWRHEIEIEL